MSFSAEIKEFLGAAKDSWKLVSDTEAKQSQAKYTDVLAKKTQQEIDDPLNQQLKEAKLGQIQASTAAAGDRARYTRWLMDQASRPIPNAAGEAAGANVIVRPSKPAVGPAEETYGTGFKRGGLVRKFQEGGLVEDEDLEDDEFVPPAIGADYISSQQRQPRPQQSGDILAPGGVPQQRRPAVGGGGPPVAQKPNAINEGLKYGVWESGLSGQAVPQVRSRSARAYAQGAGAAPVDDMLAVYKKIDPKGEMGESERNLYAINALYNYKMNSGDAVGAARTAHQMLQHYKTAQTRYGALVNAAVENGNVDDAMKLFMKQYAQVPDGKDMKLYKGKDGSLNYTLLDKDGNKVSGGIMTPEEIGSAAMKLASPGMFEQRLMAAAGGGVTGKGRAPKEKEDEGPVVGKPPKAAEYGQIEEQTSRYVDDAVTKYKASKEYAASGKEMTDPEITKMKNTMFHLRRTNDITNDEAFKAAQTYITAPEPKTKDDPIPFKVHKDKEAGTAEIRFRNGRTLRMPMDDYLPMAAMRGEALAEAEARAKEPKKKGYGEYLSGAATSAAEAAKNATVGDIVATPARAGATLAAPVVGAIGDAASAVAGAVPGAVQKAPGAIRETLAAPGRAVAQGAIGALGYLPSRGAPAAVIPEEDPYAVTGVP